MDRMVRSLLIEIARQPNGHIYYQELSDQCSLGLQMQRSQYERARIGEIIGEISKSEHSNNRPLLSSLVLTKSGKEGDDFYRLCEELGYGDTDKLKYRPDFSQERMKECYEFWQNESNYRKYKDI